MMTNCFRCGYFRKEGGTRYYCSDRDCTVDPNDPDCRYDKC